MERARVGVNIQEITNGWIFQASGESTYCGSTQELAQKLPDLMTRAIEANAELAEKIKEQRQQHPVAHGSGTSFFHGGGVRE